MRVVLMGAGHIGQTIAALLSATGDYQVKVVDRSAEALRKLSHLPLETALIALPPGHHGRHPGAQGAGCHYFDLTEDVAATREHHAPGRRCQDRLSCRSAAWRPGFIGIVAHHLSQKFTSCMK
jgi:nucleoside-diphosphate-sugar epimerase